MYLYRVHPRGTELECVVLARDKEAAKRLAVFQFGVGFGGPARWAVAPLSKEKVKAFQESILDGTLNKRRRIG